MKLLQSMSLILAGLLITGLAGSGYRRASAQDQDEGEKGIKSEEVVKRPQAKPAPLPAVKAKAMPRPTPKPPPRPKATYTANKKRPVRPPQAGYQDVRLGLTMFRYEPPGTTYQDRAEGAKDVLMEGTEEAPTPPKALTDWKPNDWTRATPDTQFAVGQVVRFHFEPLTKAGYLYVVHQELYADGTSGLATLLFPTLKTNGGNNYLEPNRDLWIPRAPAYFRLTPSKSNKSHVGELFTIVIRAEAPDKILLQTLSDKPLSLTPEAFAKLAVGASSDAIKLNLDGGAGRKQTAQETRKDVTQEGEEALGEDDPLPQTVYEARRKAGQPVLVRVPLRFKPE